MKMTDIRPEAIWAALEEQIHRDFGLNARVYDDKGFSFTGHVTWANRLCPAIKAAPQGVAGICSLAHTAMAAQARTTRAPVTQECDAGLVKICVPVFAGDEFVGVVGGCGALPAGGEVDAFLVEKIAGLSEDRVAGLCCDIPEMDQDAAERAVAFIEERLAEFLKDFSGAKTA